MDTKLIERLQKNPFYKISKKLKKEIEEDKKVKMVPFGNVVVHSTDTTKHADKIVRRDENGKDSN